MKFVFFFLGLLLFVSCEEDTIFNGDLPAPRLVLFSFIEPDSVIRVWVSTSRPLGHDIDYKASNVEGEVYINDELRGKLRHVISDQYTTDVCAGEGDRIRLVVRASGVEEASAETVIPATGPDVEVDTLIKWEADNPWSYMGIRIKITERDREHRYYRVIVLAEMAKLWKSLSRNDSLGPYIDEFYNFDKKNEPILNDQTTSFPWEDEDEDRNYYNIFSNSIFRGKSYTLNLGSHYGQSYHQEIHYRNDDERVVQEVTYHNTIKLLQLDEASYLYLRSEQTSYEEGWIDPIKVYTNVHNGLGIVGAFRTYQFVYTNEPIELEPTEVDYGNPFYDY